MIETYKVFSVIDLLRYGTLGRAVAAMRANREAWRAAEMVRFSERKGCEVVESYEMVVEGCVERGEYVLAGKVVMEMAWRGLISYLGMRQRVVKGLASIGEIELACAVRQRLARLIVFSLVFDKVSL